VQGGEIKGKDGVKYKGTNNDCRKGRFVQNGCECKKKSRFALSHGMAKNRIKMGHRGHGLKLFISVMSPEGCKGQRQKYEVRAR